MWKHLVWKQVWNFNVITHNLYVPITIKTTVLPITVKKKQKKKTEQNKMETLFI